MAKNARPPDNETSSNGAAETAVEQTRGSLVSAAQNTSSLLNAAQMFHQAQSEMLHRLAVAHQHAAENLKEARTPLEVMTQQSQLMLAGWNEAAQYTMQLLGALQSVQTEANPSARSTGRRRGE